MVVARGASSRAGKEKIDNLLSRLTLLKEEEGNFVWEKEIKEPPAMARWLAIARVNTTRGFSPTALYALGVEPCKGGCVEET